MLAAKSCYIYLNHSEAKLVLLGRSDLTIFALRFFFSFYTMIVHYMGFITCMCGFFALLEHCNCDVGWDQTIRLMYFIKTRKRKEIVI